MLYLVLTQCHLHTQQSYKRLQDQCVNFICEELCLQHIGGDILEVKLITPYDDIRMVW